MKKKKCVICDAWFVPYKRARKTQLLCGQKLCRISRNQQACYQWRKKNPDYFKGRYGNTKRWLDKYPNYLRRYRANHPEYVAADNRNRRRRKRQQRYVRADIQQRSLRRQIEGIRTLRAADIQKTLELRLDGLMNVLAGVPGADIQQGPISAGAP